jgi:hypothetical protein
VHPPQPAFPVELERHINGFLLGVVAQGGVDVDDDPAFRVVVVGYPVGDGGPGGVGQETPLVRDVVVAPANVLETPVAAVLAHGVASPLAFPP